MTSDPGDDPAFAEAAEAERWRRDMLRETMKAGRADCLPHDLSRESAERAIATAREDLRCAFPDEEPRWGKEPNAYGRALAVVEELGEVLLTFAQEADRWAVAESEVVAFHSAGRARQGSKGGAATRDARGVDPSRARALRMLAEGKSRVEVAQALQITTRTLDRWRAAKSRK